MSQAKAMSYAEAVRILNNADIQADLGDACQKLAKSTVNMMQAFDSVATQLHAIDLQGFNSPMQPKWNVIRKDFREIVWQSRTNAGFISGRLKLFCTLVLPLASRNLNGGSSRSHQEKLQVLQSYMSISSDHATLTRSLAENALKLNVTLNAFHSGFSKFVSTRVTSGQRELRDLQHKISELDTNVKQLYIAIGRLVGVEVTFLVFSAFRVILSSGRAGRAKVSRQRLTLNGVDATNVGRLYDQFDRTRNEVAHADYAAQVSHRKADALTTTRTALSTLVSDQMFTIEAGLSLFLSIWSRLQSDCTDILKWLQNNRTPELPSSVVTYSESGGTLYASLANSLDIYVAGIDPSLFSNKTT